VHQIVVYWLKRLIQILVSSLLYSEGQMMLAVKYYVCWRLWQLM